MATSSGYIDQLKREHETSRSAMDAAAQRAIELNIPEKARLILREFGRMPFGGSTLDEVFKSGGLRVENYGFCPNDIKVTFMKELVYMDDWRLRAEDEKDRYLVSVFREGPWTKILDGHYERALTKKLRRETERNQKNSSPHLG